MTRPRQGIVGNTRLHDVEFEDVNFENTLEGEITV